MGIELLKISFSSSATWGPSWLLGTLSRNFLLLPQPRLDRVSTPVMAFVPEAYRHSFCDTVGECSETLRKWRNIPRQVQVQVTYRLHGLVKQGICEVRALNVRIGQIASATCNPRVMVQVEHLTQSEKSKA